MVPSSIAKSTVGAYGNNKVAALVVGTGLAGLTAAYELLNKYNQSVVLFEKTEKQGGNSIKASSGINGVGTKQQIQVLSNLISSQLKADSIELFRKDTVKSATDGIPVGPNKPYLAKIIEVDDKAPLEKLYDKDLVERLVANSNNAIGWLTNELGLKLNKVSQLGGHSIARTHRGEKLPPGFEIVSTINKALEKYAQSDNKDGPTLKILKNAKITKLLKENDKVVGLSYKDIESNNEETVYGPVVLATGGYAADFQNEDKTNDSLLAKYRPDLLNLPSTNGPQSTGDGHKLVEDIGGQLRNMEQIQIHPTGFVNLKDPASKWKILAGEALRGTGGLLYDLQSGKRFVNELMTRDKVSAKIFDLFEQNKEKAGKDVNSAKMVAMILNESSYKEMKMNFGFYMKMGLLNKVTVQELANTVFKNCTPEEILEELNTINQYIAGAKPDPLGRSLFALEPYDLSKGKDSELYYGLVTPVIHFTMGGVRIDKNARVMIKDQATPFKGLYAAGEVTGGIHGKNRLGGSSLLECVVFGKIAAEQLSKDLQ